jgi:hypothetical protein
MNRLLKEMMDLYCKGAIKPISPVTVFPFEDIVDAFVFLRGGNHLGKIVISNRTTEKVMVPVSLDPLLRHAVLTNPGPSRSQRGSHKR